MKSNMAAPVKLKCENRGQSNCPTQILFPCFPTKFETGLYFQQFNVNLSQEWRFPLNYSQVGKKINYSAYKIMAKVITRKDTIG